MTACERLRERFQNHEPPRILRRLGYLIKVRAKKEEVVRQVGLRCSSERLAPPSRKAILARVSALDTREVAKARLQASEAATLPPVALCLTQAVLPKDTWLKGRALACAWPVWGLPRALHADNGPDFTSAALRRGCDEYGIKLILRPVATPHYGGHIERLIGTIMGRVHLLPGTTGSTAQDKGAYPAESESVLTMAELERWLNDRDLRAVSPARSPGSAPQSAGRLAGRTAPGWRRFGGTARSA